MARSRKTPLPPVDVSSQPMAPTRFRCKVGGEWLPLSSFSNAQQKLVQRRGQGQQINAANSGMTCREHSASSRTDLRCELCTLIKPVSEFSRNNRQLDEHICKRCSAWGETQEPHVTPSPLETGHVSIEESNCEVWQQQYVESNDFFDNDMPRAPITDLASLGLEDDEVLKAELLLGTTSGEAGPSSSSAAAGSEAISQLVSNMLLADNDDNEDAASQCSRLSLASGASSLPPHLRAKQKEKFPMSSAASSVASSSQTTTTNFSTSAVSTPSSLPPHLRSRALKGKAKEQKVAYNAWGPDGNLHQGLKSVTLPSSSSTSSSTPTMTDDASTTSSTGNSHKKTIKTGSKNWAKAPRLSQSELRQFEPCMPIGVAHIDPAREEARRMGYCKSDDSNY